MAVLTPEEAQLVDDSSQANQLATIGKRVRNLELINDLVTESQFMVTGTLQSANASTPVILLPESVIPAGKKAYVQGFIAKVNGATNWVTTTDVYVSDTNVSPNKFITFDAVHLNGNEVFYVGANHVTIENAFALGSGGAVGKGIQIYGNTNGSGSDFVVTIWGVIK